MRKGRSHHLLHKAITRKEKEADKIERERKAILIENIPRFESKKEKLKLELALKDEELNDFSNNQEILRKLYDDSINFRKNNYIL